MIVKAIRAKLAIYGASLEHHRGDALGPGRFRDLRPSNALNIRYGAILAQQPWKGTSLRGRLADALDTFNTFDDPTRSTVGGTRRRAAGISGALLPEPEAIQHVLTGSSVSRALEASWTKCTSNAPDPNNESKTSRPTHVRDSILPLGGSGTHTPCYLRGRRTMPLAFHVGIRRSTRNQLYALCSTA